jgi:hypothetical protein
MPDYAETTVRIGADTGLAEAALGRVSAGFDAMQARTMPGLQRSFATTSQYAMRMTGVMSSMGIGAQALTGPLGAVASGLGAIHPAFLLVAVAGGLVTGMLLKQREAAAMTAEAVGKYHGVLESLAKQNYAVSESARELARINNQIIASEMKRIEIQINSAKAGIREANAWERLLMVLQGSPQAMMFAGAGIKSLTAGSQEQHAALLALHEEWEKLRATLVTFGEAEAAFTTTVVGHRNLALAASIAENEAMLKLLETTEYAVPRMIELHRERAAVMKLGADDFVKTEKRAFDKTVLAYEILARSISMIDLRRMKEHAGFAAFMVRITGSAIQAMLEAYAKLWMAEAIALMATPGRQAEAAAKARAAALAGVGIAAVGAITEAAAAGMERRGAAIGGAERVGEGTVSMERGRTVMSQGPITLNYSAIMTIQGNVYDTSDLRLLWNQWNLDQLRTAGVDAAKRSKG